MLVLTRKREESIVIGEDCEIMVLGISGDKVRLGITAPRETTVFRKEVTEKQPPVEARQWIEDRKRALMREFKMTASQSKIQATAEWNRDHGKPD